MTIVWQSAEHEAAHAAAAWHFGWRVDEIQLYEDGGDCWFMPAEALDPVVAEHQRCVILHAPTAFVGEEGGRHDRIEIFQRTRRLARTLEEHEFLRRRCEYDATQLVAKPAFRSAASRVATALIENEGHLGSRELKLLLARPKPHLQVAEQEAAADRERWVNRARRLQLSSALWV